MTTMIDLPVLLDIYVATGCFGSHQAIEIAQGIRAEDLPGVSVRVFDLSDEAVERPASVFATPTYLVNQQVVSLGNPDPEWLRRLLRDMAHA